MPDEDIRPLLRKLGDAINNTLSESGLISEAIEEIKKGGYDVFLVLEATIGFNRREEGEEKAAPEMREPNPLVDKMGHVAPKTFDNPGDKRFLRALKITIPDG